MGDLVHLPAFVRRGTLRAKGEPALIIVLPVVRIERHHDEPTPGYDRRHDLHPHSFMTKAERRALGARWGLDETGRPLAGTPKL